MQIASLQATVATRNASESSMAHSVDNAAPAAANAAGNSQLPSRGRGRRQGNGGRHRGGGPTGPNEGRNSDAPPAATQQVPNAAPPPPAQDGNSSTQTGRGRRGRGPREFRRGGGSEANSRASNGTQRAFGGHLTAPNAGAGTSSTTGLSGEAPAFVPGQPVASRNPPASHAKGKQVLRKEPKSNADDLPTRIHDDIANGHYECVICTNEVLPNSRIWSCSICWTVAHLSCVRKWYTNQAKKSDPAAEEVSNDWRCPGCNSSRTEEPTSYHCWCGKEINPTSLPGCPPHSCSQTCGKPRSGCPHPCILTCHAGPCPPCEAMGPTVTCFCGKNTSQRPCAKTEYAKGWTCQEVCGDLLPCSEHECQRTCHPGLCGSCEIPIPSLCYCGQDYQDIPCEKRGDKIASFNHGQVHKLPPGQEPDNDGLGESWFWGNFSCDSSCERLYDCGFHRCLRDCHSQDEEKAHCPYSTDVVTHCPCTKTPLKDILNHPRGSCQDAIPSCNKPCGKMLSCGHGCNAVCHTGPCPPCMQKTEIECRCGRTKSASVCHQGNVSTPECMRVCRAQLNCGRHMHDERCCPSEKKAMERKRKRKNLGPPNHEIEAEHICVRPCGRTLKCGQHQCAQLCHSGPCPSCLEAVFEEISCNCGRTVLQPPQPCGTRPPACRYPCTRPNTCEMHPQVSHPCHEDDISCPPCPFLVEKRCTCGKTTLKNQPCASKAPRCGLVCDKKLKCGAHTCSKTCHAIGECEDAGMQGSRCPQPCLKTRKTCEHVCKDACHAPYPCPEDKPCQGKTFITCECQHRKQEVKCLASTSNPRPERAPLNCDDECLRMQRNAKLAEALNIDPATRADDHVPYSDKTLKMYQDSVKWAQTQEREFRVFAGDKDEKRLRFKPMKPHQRAFLHALAEDFGLDSESQDPEPHRHVSIFKTPRFVSAPAKTLAQCVLIKASGAAPESTAQEQPSQSKSAIQLEPYNSLLLSSPRFGLTIQEVESALAKDLAACPTLSFTTSFLPSDEILIRGTGSWTPKALETSLSGLKREVTQTVKRTDLAKTVVLCHADASLNVLRREAVAANSGGWNSVVRSSARPAKAASPGPSSSNRFAIPSKFVALKKAPKKTGEQPVVEDWSAAADKLDED